ncbi:response regulator, partial [Myxococcota bacterium]|nr:response regulator [Myxococcota bacterium]
MSVRVRALVVEDEPDLRERLVRHLRRTGAVDEIVEAWTGAETLALLRERDFAVVVLDLGLPDADGLDVLPELLLLDPSARVICLTGRDEARSAVRALEAGAAAYLVKPWSSEELEVHVRRAVERHREAGARELVQRTAAVAPGLAAGRSDE